jgi:anti-sigma factor RsiW
MPLGSPHITDQRLLLNIDGELSPPEQAEIGAHLDACWECRARRREIDHAITDFVRLHQREFEHKLPPAAGQRALLRARLAQLSEGSQDSDWFPMRLGLSPAIAAMGLTVAAIVLFVASSFVPWSKPLPKVTVFFLPDARLTPGAATLASRQAVCSQPNVKNKAVPAALQKQVFAEYGIETAEPKAYEVDYLVTPALGGADDLRNLWPHSYSAIWNAHVKEDLEDRLRSMVCDGSLELAEAQREIASNWIAAYKKYFHTEQPLDEH